MSGWASWNADAGYYSPSYSAQAVAPAQDYTSSPSYYGNTGGSAYDFYANQGGTDSTQSYGGYASSGASDQQGMATSFEPTQPMQEYMSKFKRAAPFAQGSDPLSLFGGALGQLPSYNANTDSLMNYFNIGQAQQNPRTQAAAAAGGVPGASSDAITTTGSAPKAGSGLVANAGTAGDITQKPPQDPNRTEANVNAATGQDYAPGAAKLASVVPQGAGPASGQDPNAAGKPDLARSQYLGDISKGWTGGSSSVDLSKNAFMGGAVNGAPINLTGSNQQGGMQGGAGVSPDSTSTIDSITKTLGRAADSVTGAIGDAGGWWASNSASHRTRQPLRRPPGPDWTPRRSRATQWVSIR